MADVLGSQKTSQGAMGKDKIVMPATSLGRKGNEGKALTRVWLPVSLLIQPALTMCN
jgi:hypothetical protein